MSKKTTKYISFGVAIIIAFLVFNFAFGFQILNPQNIKWLMNERHDWGTHYLGWAFYKNEPWSFPLGTINNYIWPVGTNVGFTDSIPLMALLFKPFAAFLPQDFQYFGIWMLLCYILLAIYTVKIFSLYTTNIFYILLGVVLVTSNSVLIYRSMHPALCTHWLILASVYLYIKPAGLNNVIAINRHQGLLLLISALVNPYLTLMIVGFTIILPFKHYYYDRLISIKKALICASLSFLSVFISWFVLGILTFGNNSSVQMSGSYGLNALNLNSLYNSSNFSSFFPEQPWFPLQYEGFMYLGLGMMVICLFSTAYLIYSGSLKSLIKNNKYLLPLLILSVALSLFAITNKITLNKNELLVVPLPAFIVKLGEVFRASARFFWVSYYLIFLLFTVIFIKSKIPAKFKVPLFFSLVALQLYDIKPIYNLRHLESGSYNSPLEEEKWSTLLPGFNKILVYPPFECHLINSKDYQDLGYVAVKNNVAISTGYTARTNVRSNDKYTEWLERAIASNFFYDDELIVTAPKYLKSFTNGLKNGKLNIDYIDGYFILYTKKNDRQFFSQKPEIRVIIDSVMAADGAKAIKTVP